MSLSTDIPQYRPVMLDVAGTELSIFEKKQIGHPLVGGVILFSRNFQSAEQIAELVAQMRLLKPDLLVAVDQEGGRVQRFRTDFTRLPPAWRYGEIYRENSQLGIEIAEQAGWLMATELLACGIDFSFAPVLDIDIGVSQVIGDRAFSDKPEEALLLARCFRRGMRRAGMAAVGKHFPGHGSVMEDSHVGIPVDERAFAAICECDLVPFAGLIDDGLEAIMPAHVIYPLIDENPAGFSPYWLQQVLRIQLGFQGVIFSDDLSMEGASVAGTAEKRAEAALSAGCDMVLVCNQPQKATDVLLHLTHLNMDNPESASRISRMRGRKQLDWNDCKKSPEFQNAKINIDALTEC